MSYVRVSGYVYVDLHSEEEVKKALKKNKDYIGTCFCTVHNVSVHVIGDMTGGGGNIEYSFVPDLQIDKQREQYC